MVFLLSLHIFNSANTPVMICEVSPKKHDLQESCQACKPEGERSLENVYNIVSASLGISDGNAYCTMEQFDL